MTDRTPPIQQARPAPVQPAPTETPGCLSNVARIWWSGVGIFPLFLLTFKIGQERGFVLNLSDALFVAFWMLLVVVRVVDVVVLHGTMGTPTHDRPSTLKDAWKYVALATLATAMAWGAAHLVAVARG